MSAATSETVAHQLSKVLADSYSVYLKTHGYHWNVRGPNFAGLHKLFMDQYSEIWTALDELAERIRALGEFAPMSGSAFANLTALKDGDAALSSEGMLTDLKASHEVVIETMEKALDFADEAGDDPTVDLLTQRLAAHQKHLWMITASLS
jgi:starvation-inducible DNA-binding protein